MLVIECERDQRKRAVVLDVGEIWNGKQRTTQPSNRPLMCGEGKNRPRKTPGCCEGRSGAFQVLDRDFHDPIVRSVTKRQQCDRRVVGVRSDGGSVDNAISSIPSSAGAGAIEKHLNCTIHPPGNQLEAAARTRDLL